MTKADFVVKMVEKTGFTKADAEKAVNAFLETIAATLNSGDRVAFASFGTFEVVGRAARTGRNPQTGELIQVEASRVPKFRPGKGLKDAVA
jgi:DNA-binding protein HU-beta